MVLEAASSGVAAIPGFSEPVSSISHLIAAATTLALMPALLRLGRGEWRRLSAVCVYLFGVLFLFSVSGAYHSLEPLGAARAVMQRLDHAAIWVLIAGTFTPIHVVAFRHWAWRWGGLLLIWTLALTGLVLKTIFFTSLPEALGVGFYLGLGWMGLFLIYRLSRLWGFRQVTLLWMGGVAYSVGAAFELSGVPTLLPRIIGPHELFHLAVIVGALLHGLFIRKALLRNPVAPAATEPRVHSAPLAAEVSVPAVL